MISRQLMRNTEPCEHGMNTELEIQDEHDEHERPERPVSLLDERSDDSWRDEESPVIQFDETDPLTRRQRDFRTLRGAIDGDEPYMQCPSNPETNTKV